MPTPPKNTDVYKRQAHALRLQQEGADLIDIGAQSTRPGFTPVSSSEEWERLRPVLEGLAGELSVPISIDTFYPDVAERALKLSLIHIFSCPPLFWGW